jgi:hypothetical protein
METLCPPAVSTTPTVKLIADTVDKLNAIVTETGFVPFFCIFLKFFSLVLRHRQKNWHPVSMTLAIYLFGARLANRL